jgi:hypothetical protein
VVSGGRRHLSRSGWSRRSAGCRGTRCPCRDRTGCQEVRTSAAAPSASSRAVRRPRDRGSSPRSGRG